MHANYTQIRSQSIQKHGEISFSFQPNFVVCTQCSTSERASTGACPYDSLFAFFANPINGLQGLADGIELTDLRKRKTRFAPPIGPLLPGAGYVLRQWLEPKILEIDQQYR